MNILVLGSNGMAGHVISLYFQEQGHMVKGFARKQSTLVETIVGDARDASLLHNTIGEGSFDAVINCIGVLNQFAETDKPDAVYLNAYLPHFLADITQHLPTRIVHMSTDCVFSGKRGPYEEKALRDGETFYDRSKALGELEDSKNLTLRNSIVGPDTNPKGIGLLNWFMQQQGQVRGFTGSIWTGQTTLQLAKTMEAALTQGVVGLINAVPPLATNKFELLRLFNHYLRNDAVEIHPVEGIVQDKTLLRTNDDFSYQIPDYAQMVREMADWMQLHSALYPHYHLTGKENTNED